MKLPPTARPRPIRRGGTGGGMSADDIAREGSKRLLEAARGYVPPVQGVTGADSLAGADRGRRATYARSTSGGPCPNSLNRQPSLCPTCYDVVR
jgi:hypothetical protein